MIRQCALLFFLLGILSCAEWQEPSAAQDPLSQIAATETVAERGQRLELDTALAGPPGDPASHYAMGFARVLCSAIFVSGLEADFAIKNVGFFTSPPETRGDIGDTAIDQEAMTVTVTTDTGIMRVARYIGDLGCVPLPMGESSPYFEPPIIETTLADAATTPWPMGDSPSQAPPVVGVDSAKLDTALDVFFTEGALSAAIVVTVQGEIVAERYGPGITPQTPLESWSMGKSLTATLLGVLIQQGEYVLTQPAPIPEWQAVAILAKRSRFEIFYGCRAVSAAPHPTTQRSIAISITSIITICIPVRSILLLTRPIDLSNGHPIWWVAIGTVTRCWPTT